MARTIEPDDDVYRVNTVWLGPKDWTLPWTARYQTYGLVLVFFVLISLFGVITGFHLGKWPFTEICEAIFVAHAVMKVVDYERPFKAHVGTVRTEGRRIARRGRHPVGHARVVLRVHQGPRPSFWRQLPRRTHDTLGRVTNAVRNR